ncbi:MAG: DUF952 domain-containing protein [Anaerolineae bacterium]|nr:DUF952 domain-containing protein [Anaerolineae bacterium]
MSVILHILSRSAWQAAQAAGEYRPASLAEEGFIHTSEIDQVLGVANRFYAGQSDLVLLVINPDQLTSDLRYEKPSGGAPAPGLFPHIYGPLNLEAVCGVFDFPMREDGRFSLPAGIGG